ncbi:hypothetical protein [Fontibacillus sp. BL9]|uniref:hypothetical protein n=1 Tax=Fontibacillus sp. BL9 TaxID=3389971 RepID=UPI00397C190C
MISVSLSEWIIWLHQHDSVSLTAFLALGLFLGLYGATEWSMRLRERSRLHRISTSLELYAAAESPLIQADGRSELSRAEEQLMMDRLLACRAAPYITADGLAQISAYAGDRDAARLPLLLKTLERETERLCEERDKLLRRTESPGWGYALWKQIRPALPFLFAAALLYEISWLMRMLSGEIPVTGGSFEEYLNIWTQFASAIFSLLLLYPALLGGYRLGAGYVLQRLWSVFIAALFLLQLLDPAFAPYILAIQVLLFLAGFRFTGSKPRKSRPYVGHFGNDQDEPGETVDEWSGLTGNNPEQPSNSPEGK